MARPPWWALYASSDNGAAYLYAEAAGAWPSTPAASFAGTGGGYFGYSVALSADGQAALVGPVRRLGQRRRLRLRRVGRGLAHHRGGQLRRHRGRELRHLGGPVGRRPGRPGGAQFAGSGNGAAYVYAETAGAWPSTPAASFAGTGGEALGTSVALSADGQVALVGAPYAGSDNGAADLYGPWTRSATPAASFAGTGSEALGTSVALSADGQVALVGAPGAGSGNGAAYVYAESAGAWPSTPAASFAGTGSEELGWSVALSADGQAALVGAPFASSFDGGAYVYAESAGAWPSTPAASFAGTGGGYFGWSVALSADGQAALVGPRSPAQKTAPPTSTPSRPGPGRLPQRPVSPAPGARSSAGRWPCPPTARPPWWGPGAPATTTAPPTSTPSRPGPGPPPRRPVSPAPGARSSAGRWPCPPMARPPWWRPVR